MKKKQLKITLDSGEVLIGTELPLTDPFFRANSFIVEAQSAFDGIWFLHSNRKKVSFLSHDIIVSKEEMK